MGPRNVATGGAELNPWKPYDDSVPDGTAELSPRGDTKGVLDRPRRQRLLRPIRGEHLRKAEPRVARRRLRPSAASPVATFPSPSRLNCIGLRAKAALMGSLAKPTCKSPCATLLVLLAYFGQTKLLNSPWRIVPHRVRTTLRRPWVGPCSARSSEASRTACH
jgi:hypothetical protein